MIRNCGTRNMTAGRRRVAISKPNRSRLPGKSIRAKAYPDIDVRITTRTVPIDALRRLVTNQLTTGKSDPKMVLKFSRLGFCGIHPVSVNTSDPALSDVEIIQTIGATKKTVRRARTAMVARCPGVIRQRRGVVAAFCRGAM